MCQESKKHGCVHVIKVITIFSLTFYFDWLLGLDKDFTYAFHPDTLNFNLLLLS